MENVPDTKWESKQRLKKKRRFIVVGSIVYCHKTGMECLHTNTGEMSWESISKNTNTFEPTVLVAPDITIATNRYGFLPESLARTTLDYTLSSTIEVTFRARFRFRSHFLIWKYRTSTRSKRYGPQKQKTKKMGRLLLPDMLPLRYFARCRWRATLHVNWFLAS